MSRTNYNEVLANLKSKNMTIRRITKDNPYREYLTGFLVHDDFLPYPTRWGSLKDIWEECCLYGKLSNGMVKRG